MVSLAAYGAPPPLLNTPLVLSMSVGVHQLAWRLWCRSTKDAAPPSDSDPASPSEMMADEPTAPVSGKRKPGAAGKKQPAAPKDFDPFEEDMDDGAVDTTTATKRRKHGPCLLTDATYFSEEEDFA